MSSKSLKFTKLQGAGNDFVLVADGDVHDWSRLAIAMCDRHFGVGSDGLLVLLPSNIANFRMRMFNPDGSEAGACGNGLRCLARYILTEGLVDNRATQILVETMAGTRVVRFNGTGEDINIQVSLGKPQFGVHDIPAVLDSRWSHIETEPVLDYPLVIGRTKLKLNLVSMGNPHAIHFWKRPVADFPLSTVGPKMEHHGMFPDRVNFEVAHVISREEIEARVWERGAGETLACGSGTAAIVAVARLHDYVDNYVNVKLQGGTLKVQWSGTGEIFLSGPAEVVFNGEWLGEV